MESWARDFADWDVCDQCCINFFGRTPFARHFAAQWSGAEPEFVKRADDASFEWFFALITREFTDQRNYVHKAVNWALRQIGKRNRALNEGAVAVARIPVEPDRI